MTKKVNTTLKQLQPKKPKKRAKVKFVEDFTYGEDEDVELSTSDDDQLKYTLNKPKNISFELTETKYTWAESREILENTIKNKKSDKRIYNLLLMWLAGAVKKAKLKIVKVLANGYLDLNNFENNSPQIQNLIQGILLKMVETTRTGRGFRDQVDWTRADHEIVSMVKTQVYEYWIYNTSCYEYRDPKVNARLTKLKKDPKLLDIKKIAESRFDYLLIEKETRDEAISQGHTDGELYLYRQVFSLGSMTSLVPFEEDVQYEGTIDNEDYRIERKKVYEVIYDIVNGSEMPPILKMFLRVYYQIPLFTPSETGDGTIKVSYEDMKQFFRYHPIARKQFQDEQVYLSAKGKTLYRKVLNKEKMMNSIIYKTAHQILKSLLIQKLGKDFINE